MQSEVSTPVLKKALPISADDTAHQIYLLGIIISMRQHQREVWGISERQLKSALLAVFSKTLFCEF